MNRPSWVTGERGGEGMGFPFFLFRYRGGAFYYRGAMVFSMGYGRRRRGTGGRAGPYIADPPKPLYDKRHMAPFEQTLPEFIAREPVSNRATVFPLVHIPCLT